MTRRAGFGVGPGPGAGAGAVIGRWIFIRDGRWSRRRKLALAGIAGVALLALLPLRLVLGLAGGDGTLSAEAVEGSAWSGRVGGLFVGRLPLGTLDVALRPLPLLLGRAEFGFERSAAPAAAPLRAIARTGGGGIAVRQATGEIALAGAMAPLPVRTIRLADFHVAMADGACREASGSVGLVLPGLGPLLPADTALAGEARCEGGALVVPMVGPSGMERLLLRVTGDGRWTAELLLSNLPADVSAPLLQAGFKGRPGGIGMSASGRL